MSFIMKLCFLLLFGSVILAQGKPDDRRFCLRQKTRFKNLKQYFYNYEAETSNGIVGTENSRSGVRISCTVELEVPQYCAYSMRTNACTLKEVQSISADGKPIFRLSKDTEEFQQAMSKYELKFTTVNGHMGVNLYPNKNEPTNILNIKRGIISTLLVPVESNEDVQTFDTASVYGNCTSEIIVDSRVDGVATHITVGRDLTACNRFTPITDHRSPLALITGMHVPAASLLDSSQSCSYSLDGKKHIIEATCNEKHILLPFSQKSQYGAASHVKQTLQLKVVNASNNRHFTDDESTIRKELTLEHMESRVKNADFALSALQNLVSLSESGQNEQRASLFQAFVVELRRMEKDALETALPKFFKMEMPRSITVQALMQCGTPECFGAILKLLQSEPIPQLVADTVIYAIGLMASPSESRIQEVLNLAKFRQTRGTFYALSHTVRKFYEETKSVVPELKAVVDYLMSILGSDCSGDEDTIYLTLKALGNMGQAMENANPEIKQTLIKCVKNSKVSSNIQQAAVQAFRKMNLTDEIRSALLHMYTDEKSPVLRRLRAYLIVMKDPSSSNLRRIIRNLGKLDNVQVQSFVSTHMRNILKSEDPAVQTLKKKLSDALKDTKLTAPRNFKRLSRNYNVYKKFKIPRVDSPVEAGLQSNVIFEPEKNMPSAVMLETTLNAFGKPIDLFEFGLDGNGFEPSLEAMFGPKGFFPDSAMKALYWMDGKMPEKVSQTLFNWFGMNKEVEESKQDVMNELSHNFRNVLNELETQMPEVEAFLRIFGNELGYIKGSDFKLLREMMSTGFQLFQSLPAKLIPALQKGINADMFAHYIFMDSQINLPTGAGLPLKLSMSGTIAPGGKAGIKFAGQKIEGLIKPAVAIEFAAQMGINVPTFVRNGIQINSNLYHESGFEAWIRTNNNQIKFSIPAPKKQTKLFSVRNKLSLLHNIKTEEIEMLKNNEQKWTTCKPLLSGLEICPSSEYREAGLLDNVPSNPLTVESRFVVYVRPTGTVESYSASATYQSQKINEDLEHSLKLAVEVEGSENTEVAAEIKYNAKKQVLTGDVHIPNFDLEVGVKLGVEDKSALKRKAYAVKLDFTNRKVPEVSLIGRASYDDEQKDLSLQCLFAIPDLEINANIGTQIRHPSDEWFTAFNVEASVPYFKASYDTNLKYGAKNIQVAWSSDVSSDLKPINEKITNIKMPDMSEHKRTVNGHLDNFLDWKVPQTDMTVRHIVFESMKAVNNSLQQATSSIPYAATLQSKLQVLQNINFDQMKTYFTLPENLFLKSHGSIAGTFSDKKKTIKIPIPFGGTVIEKHPLFSKALEVQPMVMKVFGLNSQFNENDNPRRISTPATTIPKTYHLRIPLIEKFQFSTNMNSNYYNCSSKFMTEYNANKDSQKYSTEVDIHAVSTLDFLSYHLTGSILSNQKAEDEFTRSISSKFQHTLLKSEMNLLQEFKYSDHMETEMTYDWLASSDLGAQASLLSKFKVVNESPSIKIEGVGKGTLNISSYDCTWTHRMSQTINEINGEFSGDSISNINSFLIQVNNKMVNSYKDNVFMFESSTDGSWSHLNNLIKLTASAKKFELTCDTMGHSNNGDFNSKIKLTADTETLKMENNLRAVLFGVSLITMDELKYSNREFTACLKTTGKYNEMTATNNLLLLLSIKNVTVEHKWNTQYYDKIFHNILAATFDEHGLKAMSETGFPGVRNRGILQIAKSGLSTEVISSVGTPSFMVTQNFSMNINQEGAVMNFGISDETNNVINLNIKGRANSNGINTNSFYSSLTLKSHATNSIDLQFSKEKGLILHTTTKAFFKQAQFNHVHHLSIDSWTLSASDTIEASSSLDSNIKYQQTSQVDMQPFTVSISFDNRFNYRQLNASHVMQLSLEPLKLEFKGELAGSQNDNHVAHSYILKCANWKALLSANTTGQLENMNLNQKTNLEINGFSAIFSSDAFYNSRALQFRNKVLCTAIPFVFAFEADASAKGLIEFWGFHNGELSNKLQMKAEPLALALHHNFKGTSEHKMPYRELLKSLLESNLNVLLIPTEQTSKWALKSQLNNSTYMQTIDAYNNPEKIGIDVANVAEIDFSSLIPLREVYFLPFDILNSIDLTELQKFQISGNLNYDKNGHVHVINIPLLKNLPLYLKSFMKSIQYHLKEIKLSQFVQKCKKGLGQVNDFIKGVDLNVMINEAKDRLLTFVTDYQLVEHFQFVLMDFHNSTCIKLQNVISYLKECDKTQLKETMEHVINLTVNALQQLTEKSDSIINRILEFLQTFDLNAVQNGISDWIQEFDTKHQIKAQLQIKLEELQNELQRINFQEISNKLRKLINFNAIIEKLEQYLNTYNHETKKIIENMHQGLLWLLEHYEISAKISSINAKIQKMINIYKIDTLAQKVLNETVNLIKSLKVKETIQGIITTLKKISVKSHIDRAVQYIDKAIEQIELYDYQALIDKVNEFFTTLITKLRQFDYNGFVDQTNVQIQNIVNTVKDKMEDVELSQKVEAVKKSVREIQSIFTHYALQLKQKNLNELVSSLTDVLRSIALSLRSFVETSYGDTIEELFHQMSRMNIHEELQRQWWIAVNYWEIVTIHLSTAYDEAVNKIRNLAEKHNITEIVDQILKYLDEGFIFPELDMGFMSVPEFEISIRAFRKAEFNTPSFIVPLTNLKIPSYHVNLKNLRDVRIPAKIAVPSFIILDLITVPDFTIDLEKMKNVTVTFVKNIWNFDFSIGELNTFPDVSFLKSILPDVKFPEIDFSAFNMPDIKIPKVNLDNFMSDDIKIPEFQLPQIPHEVSVPAFGKLTGTFIIDSPIYGLDTRAGIHNTTVVQNSTKILAFITAKSKSSINILSFNFEANGQLSSPEQTHLELNERITLHHSAINVDHMGDLTFTRPSVNGKAKTTVTITTEVYNAEIINILTETKMETTYKHRLSVPRQQFSNDVSLHNTIQSSVDEMNAALSVITTGNGNLSFRSFLDEGTHHSELKLNLNELALLITFSGDTLSKYIMLKQNFKTEVFSSFTAKLDLKAETNLDRFVRCTINVNGKADLASLKMELRGSHNSTLNGLAVGPVENSFHFTAEPFSIDFIAKNNANVKLYFFMALPGKIEYLNDYALVLKPNEQQFTWEVTSSFNQYRYIHEMFVKNSEESINMYLTLNGNANLDFLTKPISIPTMLLHPYFSFKTPVVRNFSLWEHAGLKSFLRTTRQSITLSMKSEYKKNKDFHNFKLNMKPVYNQINGYLPFFVAKFEGARNNILNLLQKIESSRLQVNPSGKKLHLPGFTIPGLKIDVSPFRLEIPTFIFVTARTITTPTFTLPIINFIMPSYNFVIPSPELTLVHIPDSLYTLTLPKMKMPRIQDTIKIPAMGNLTSDFSFKSSLVTLSAHVELFNQTDIIARYSTSSSSIFTSNFKAEGTTSMARRRGLKLATTISVDHDTIRGKHDSTISLTRRNMEASVSTEASIKLNTVDLTFKHDLKGKAKSKPNLSSKMSLQYRLSMPLKINVKGNASHSLTLADFTSYLNLETSTNAHIDGTVQSKNKFSGSLNNDASIYLGSNNTRSSVKLELSSSIDTASGNSWKIATNENFAVAGSTSHLFAIWDHSGDNMVTLVPTFKTKGHQKSKITLELSFWNLIAELHSVIYQPSNVWDMADIQYDVSVAIKPTIQEVKWNNNGHLLSAGFSDNVEILNNGEKIHLGMVGSLQGYLNFLKEIELPVYEKNLWDILKFDLTTAEEKQQYLNVSASIELIKNEKGFIIPLPVQVLADGLKINIPEITLRVPDAIKNAPELINNLLPEIENVHIPDEVEIPEIRIPLINILVPSYKLQLSEMKLPRIIITPQFTVPYTTLQVPSYTINLREIAIPSEINVHPFEVSLPNLPTVSLPKVSLHSTYIELEHYLEVTVSEFKIMISQFTLPKSFGNYLQLDNITKQIADFELPTITIPAKTVEIPALKSRLPLALVLPSFKSLTGKVKVSSPIYNTSWITSVKSDQNKADVLTATAEATSSSTLRFLEYELSATIALNSIDNTYKLLETYEFSHPDLSVNWQQNCTFKYLGLPSSLRIDVKSPTFTDLSVRWQENNGRVSSSVSSPSAGFLGMIVQKKKSNVLYAKLYVHKPKSSDLVILDSKVSLENPEYIQVEFNWSNNVTTDMVNGLKERTPKMIQAVYNCVNKYHKEHLGIEMSVVSSKAKDLMKQNVDKLYKKTINGLKELDDHLQSTVDNITSNYQLLKEKTKKLYKRAAAKVTNVDFEQKITELLDMISNLMKEYQNKLNELINEAIKFLKYTKLHLPGLADQFTGQQLYNKTMKQAKQFINNFNNFIEIDLRDAVKYAKRFEMRFPINDTIVKASEILSHLSTFLKQVEIQLLELVRFIDSLDIEQYLKGITQAELMSVNFKSVKAKVNQLYNETVNLAYADKLQTVAGHLKEYLLKVVEENQVLLPEKIREVGSHVKSFFDKYVPQSWFSCTEKCKEIEEKLIELLNRLMEFIKEKGPKLINASIRSASNLKHEATKFVANSTAFFNNYFKDKHAYFQEISEKIIPDYFQVTKKELGDIFADIKKHTTTYKRTIKTKLDEAVVYLSGRYENLIAQGNYSFDWFIENWIQFTEYLFRFLEQIANKLTDGIELYVQRQPEQLIINVPHHLQWKSFDEMPQLKEGALNQLNVTITKGQQVLQRGTALAWELFMENHQKDKKLLKGKRTKSDKSTF
ncbi:apolipoprotein B-100 [Stegostoma tigrinum]|uniref:apolipoprotein B-100 n=1 Tax=Stegostoma tigrinum TaxID=3053191 RepID=UPI002870A0B9|nr:apolipoprotein B-100 [Stegostoma tigrinum]